jgi:hypothetical protein
MFRVSQLSRGALWILLLYLYNNPLHGQDEELLYKNRVFIAPDFGLLAGTTTMIEFSPAVGYYIAERICLAAGFIYEYYSQSSYPSFKTDIYGPRAYARVTLIKNLGDVLPVQSNLELLGHVEYESLSLENEYFGLQPMDAGRFWYSTVLLGGGISQRSYGRLKFNVLILWDVDTSSMSPNPVPLMRIGIQILLGKMNPYY